MSSHFRSPPVQAINSWEYSSPSVALYRHVARGTPIQGFGIEYDLEGNIVSGQEKRSPSPDGYTQAPPSGAGLAGLGLGVGVIAGIILFAVAVNYQIGKAMAPSKQKEASWAWGNAIGGTLFPPVTIGLAVYKNYFMD